MYTRQISVQENQRHVFGSCAEGLQEQLDLCSQLDQLHLPKNIYIHIFGLYCKSLKPKTYIAYDCEQLERSSVMSEYIQHMKNALCVWSPFPNNVKYWKEHYQLQTIFVPMWYCVPRRIWALPYLNNETKENKNKQLDIVLFGNMNQRRSHIEQEFKNKKTKFKKMFGQELQKSIQQTKIILNVKYYPKSSLEVHRIDPLLAQGHLVISESSKTDPELDSIYKNVVPMIDYHKLPKLIDEWLEKPKYEILKHKEKCHRFIRNMCLNRYLLCMAIKQIT